MTSSRTAPATKTCECGCGAEVARRFKPGHDAKLKSRLLAATKDSKAWVREAAVLEMVLRNWGHFVDGETLARTPVRSRHGSRWVESRHVDGLLGTVVDEAGTAHSHWSCPVTEGQGRWVEGVAGWTCGTCTHTQDLTEMVWSRRMVQVSVAKAA
jgi:hypothetical protein